MNLNFFSSQFPFKTAESFIENELPIVANQFDEINIFPHFFQESNHRSIPGNSNVIQLKNFTKKKLSKAYFILVIKFFILELTLTNRKLFYLKKSKERLSYLKQSAQKAQIIEEENLLLPNSVNYSFWMNEWALVLAFLKKRKVIKSFVFRICGFDIWDERREGNYMPFRALIYKYASHVWPNAKSAADYVKAKNIYSEKVDHKYFGTKDLGLGKFESSDSLTVISISNTIPLKRIELIIESLKLVKSKVNWIHFGSGTHYDEISKLALRELPHHNVSFKGRLEKFEDVLKFYIENTVDVFITTSSTEGMPVTIMEALSFGVPVIATNVGGISEMISEKTGYLIEKDFNPKDVANFINSFKNSEYNTLKKRQEIREYWQSRFNADKIYHNFALELKKTFIPSE